MALGLTPDFLMFSLVFIALDFALGIPSKKILHIDGIDFLFFAPWLAGIKFGIYEGIVLAVVMLVIQILINMKIAYFILLSFPAPLLSVLSGYFFGLGGFWITLVVYYLISSLITGLLGGLGGGYFMFLLFNSITNIITFFVYRFLFWSV